MVTGPDEYSALVSDNYYTNKVAEYNIIKLFEYLSLVDSMNIELSFSMDANYLKELKSIIGKFPVYSDNGITAQDRDFLNKKKIEIDSIPQAKFPLLLNYHPLFIYRHQVCKQADLVLAHYLFFDDMNHQQVKNDTEYYDSITTHDSSLSYSVFSIVYKKLGMLVFVNLKVVH